MGFYVSVRRKCWSVVAIRRSRFQPPWTNPKTGWIKPGWERADDPGSLEIPAGFSGDLAASF